MRYIARRSKLLNIVRVKVAFLIMFSSPLWACEKTLTIHASKNWLPYSYEVNDVFKGLDIEVLELVLEKADLCWRYVSLPSTSRAIVELKKGNIDLIFAASYNDDRASLGYFTKPYRTESSVLYTHVNNDSSMALSDSTSVAVNRGGFYGREFADYRSKCENCVIEVSLASQRFYLLKNRRVDFVIEDSLAGQYVAENMEFSNQIKATEHVVHNNMVHYLVAKNSFSEDKLAQINQVITQSKAEINAIMDKYQHNL